MPLHANIDFVIVPSAFCATKKLQGHVSASIGCDPSIDREALIVATEKLHGCNKKVLEPQSNPIQIKTWSLEGVLKRKPDSQWTIENYYSIMKNDFFIVCDSLINSMLPAGNKHSIERDMGHFKASATHKESMQHENVCCVVAGLVVVMVFKICITPSMKINVNVFRVHDVPVPWRTEKHLGVRTGYGVVV